MCSLREMASLDQMKIVGSNTGNSVTQQIFSHASKYTKKHLYFISYHSNPVRAEKITNLENKTLKSQLLFSMTFLIVVEV